MSFMTKPIVLWVRGQMRRFGFSSIINKLIQRKDYEAAYWRALTQTIRAGDCIWDVGANVGYYTVRFADLIGSEGRVIAFEPSQRNFERLQTAVAGRRTVALIPLGLSDEAKQAWIRQGDDELGATSEIMRSEDQGKDGLQPVRLERGDRLIEQREVLAPDIIKVDVEGHEYEVIEGLRATLRNPVLRAVFIEMHFAILSARGRPDAPADIERILRDSGFEIRWTDPSHLQGLRPEHCQGSIKLNHSVTVTAPNTVSRPEQFPVRSASEATGCA
jgi:FkbM family methyltransferase